MRISRIRRAVAACAMAAGFLGSSVAFTQQASAELLEPDVVDPALDTGCNIQFPVAARSLTIGVSNIGFVAIHGVVAVTNCTPAGVGPGNLTLSIVETDGTTPAPCIVLPPTVYPVVAGAGAGEITAECPAGVANPRLYRIRACVVWPGKVPTPFCASSPAPGV